jgi:hypothetical protein
MPNREPIPASHRVPDVASSSGTPSGLEVGIAPGPPNARHHARRIALKVAASLCVIGVCAAVTTAATWSNLNDTATNPSNSFTAGTVQVSINSSGSAVLSLSNAKPGAVSTGCIQVLYTGSLAANVKLYGSGGGTGLNQYLNLTVTRGTFSGTPPAGSCTGFTADSTNYISQGAGVIYSGTLANWPSSAASALGDPTSSSPATWNTNSSHGYQFQVTLQSNAAGQGLTGNETFTFEADNT